MPTAATETLNPAKLAEVQRRATLPFLGAIAVDISTTDAVPALNEPGGVALVCRGLNAQVAGLVKVDLVDGTTGVTLYVTLGNNPMAVTKVYKTGTDVGLVGKLAFLF